MPVLLISDLSEDAAGVALLVLLLVQDSVLVVAALLLASSKLRLRAWHWHLRHAARADGRLTALAFAVMLGFEFGYIELLHVETTNVEELGEDSLIAGFAVATAVIVVAPVAGGDLLPRLLLPRPPHATVCVVRRAIDGAVFGSLHFQGVDTASILPVIAIFGVGQCLVYERIGSLFAVAPSTPPSTRSRCSRSCR